MTTRPSRAFAGAHTASFERLGRNYVEWFLNRVEAAGLAVSSLKAAFAGFRDMDSRPEELAKAVQQFQGEVPTGRGADADTAFATIFATWVTSAAELDLQCIEDARELVVRAFSRIAAAQARGLYMADTLASSSESVNREISMT